MTSMRQSTDAALDRANVARADELTKLREQVADLVRRLEHVEAERRVESAFGGNCTIHEDGKRRRSRFRDRVETKGSQ